MKRSLMFKKLYNGVIFENIVQAYMVSEGLICEVDFLPSLERLRCSMDYNVSFFMTLKSCSPKSQIF